MEPTDAHARVDGPPAASGSDPATLSIGALARATGVPAPTIRTWEQRYGFPQPLRRPSGHRVYPLDAVPRLRRIVHAISRGHRAAHVIALDADALDSLLDSESAGPLDLAAVAPRTRGPGRRAAPATGALRSMRKAVRELDGARLQGMLESAAARLDPVVFIDQVASPLMRAVGDDWASGRLDVRHEHFASARLADVLRQARRPFDSAAIGPRVVLASLPGDFHEVGLLTAALVFASAGWQVLYLGRDTPPDQLRALANEVALDCVGIGISATAPRDVARTLNSLRRALPERLPIVVGGGGASGTLPGVTFLRNAGAVREWIDQQRERPV